MRAGRELDALVAEKVMETFIPRGSNPTLRDDAWIDLEGYFVWVPPSYSTDIAAAWQVVEKLKEKWAVEIHVRYGAYCCQIEEGDEVTAHFVGTSEAETAPLAICLAALEAMGVAVPA